jgi:small subunit ribosomal protein S1
MQSTIENPAQAAATSVFAQLLASHCGPVNPDAGTLVKGTYLGKGLVDFGGKSDGRVSSSELAHGEPPMNVETTFLVLPRPEEDLCDVEELPVLSYYLAQGWTKAQAAKENNETVEVHVRRMIKKAGKVAGLSASFEGIRGFIPTRKLKMSLKDIEAQVGQTLTVKVLEVDSVENRLVFDQSAAADQGREALFNELIAGLSSTTPIIRSGVVVNKVDYGVFVDLGENIRGLVHRNEGGCLLRLGETVEVIVLSIEGEQRRVELGTKLVPFFKAAASLKVGQEISGVIKTVTAFGAFVRLGDSGVDGLLHSSQIGNSREALTVGQQITTTVISIDTDRRRIGLSTRVRPS